jgi:hypothetical protein
MTTQSLPGMGTRTREFHGTVHTISEAHWVADLYDWLPDDELSEMAADMLRNGQLLTILRNLDGHILDGRNREFACRIAGIEPRYGTVDIPEDRIPAFIASLNQHRRHSTREKNREIIRATLFANPAQSNLAIASAVGVSDKTVDSVRKAMEATSEIPKLEMRQGRDSKSRPASPKKRPSRKSKSDKVPSITQSLREIVTRFRHLLKKVDCGSPLWSALETRGIVWASDEPEQSVRTGEYYMRHYEGIDRSCLELFKRIMEAIDEAEGKYSQ